MQTLHELERMAVQLAGMQKVVEAARIARGAGPGDATADVDAVVRDLRARVAALEKDRAEARALIDEWLRAYPEDICAPDAEPSRDRIAAQMGRHMATRLLEWIDRQRGEQEENVTELSGVDVHGGLRVRLHYDNQVIHARWSADSGVDPRRDVEERLVHLRQIIGYLDAWLRAYDEGKVYF